MIEERPLYSEWPQKNAKIAKTAKERRRDILDRFLYNDSANPFNREWTRISKSNSRLFVSICGCVSPCWLQLCRAVFSSGFRPYLNGGRTRMISFYLRFISVCARE